VKRALVGAALAATVFSASAQIPEEEARYRALIAELRCMVCQNQSIAESNAPLAEDLRQQVRVQIDAGKSDAEIIEFLTGRYGDFVRYRPAFKGQTLLLWLGPFALLALAGLVAARFVRRSRAVRAAPAADARQLADVLDGEDRQP
jgi:cytochrome c-type biogenesis protein CcmH